MTAAVSGIDPDAFAAERLNSVGHPREVLVPAITIKEVLSDSEHWSYHSPVAQPAASPGTRAP